MKIRFPRPLSQHWNTICRHHRLQLGVFGWRFCRLNRDYPEFTGFRVWLYTRKHALHRDVFFDRRAGFA